MLRFLLVMLITGLPAQAMAYSKAAEFLIKEQIASGCESQGGTFLSVEERDLTGDGKSDLIIDHSYLRCNGERLQSVTCGAAHCEILIYVRQGNLLKKVEEFASIGYSIENDRSPPTIGLVSFDYKEHTIRWNGRRFGKGGVFLSPVPGKWHYGGTSDIGVAAHYAKDGASIGFACKEYGGYSVALRLSPEFIPGTEADGGVAFIFEDLQHGSTRGPNWEKKFDSFHEEMMEPDCGDFNGWRKNRTLYIIRGNGGFETVGDKTLFTITQNGQDVRLHSIDDLAKLKNVKRILLDGAGEAIDDLIRFCPAIKRNQDIACNSDMD